MESELKRRLSLLGVPVDTFSSIQDLREYVVLLANNGQSNQIIFLTYRMLAKARRNVKTMQLVTQAALVLPCEPSVIKGLSFVYREPLKAFVAIDVVMAILGALENSSNKSAYVLGGNQKKAAKAYQNLKASYPKMLFVGYHPGNLKQDEEARVIEAIRKASPTVLLTSRGLPRQDRWLHQHKDEFKSGLTLYCRDCFAIFIGKKKRPIKKELNATGGFRLSRLLSYPFYGILLLSNRVKVKRMMKDE
jgi:N-acetylglucosaminyldiphosphoundecaprenol N-acetyl-beta-D-mannosaminyltransferase